MPSKSLNLHLNQLRYIEHYSAEHGVSESKAARVLLDNGIEVDKAEEQE